MRVILHHKDWHFLQMWWQSTNDQSDVIIFIQISHFELLRNHREFMRINDDAWTCFLILLGCFYSLLSLYLKNMQMHSISNISKWQYLWQCIIDKKHVVCAIRIQSFFTRINSLNLLSVSMLKFSFGFCTVK